jgi:hypothetical protein
VNATASILAGMVTFVCSFNAMSQMTANARATPQFDFAALVQTNKPSAQPHANQPPVPGANRLFAFPAPKTNQLPQSLALGHNSIAGLPKPGVYTSAPYTCIVVVPGDHPDDKSIVGGRGVGQEVEPMPMYKPELRLIPRGTK